MKRECMNEKIRFLSLKYFYYELLQLNQFRSV